MNTTEQKVVKLRIKSCAPYAKGWQVNATINGEESEITFYGYTKSKAEASAMRMIEREGRLPHAPYKG